MKSIKRIGVLTGGGDCPGLNAVIRAVVKTAINVYHSQVVGIEDGFEGLIKPGKARNLSLSDVKGILPRGGTILGTSNRGNPFAYEMEVDGKKVIKDVSDIVISNIKTLNIDTLIVIGGDGSLKISKELFEKGVPVIGVPKTIDNDISATAVTFGFDTALNTATEAIDKLHTTAESHHRVMVVEVMGRNAGWIAMESGIAGGADIILIPEIPYDIPKVCEKIMERERENKKFSIVVVAEGAKPIGGDVVTWAPPDPSGVPRLGGIAHRVGEKIGEITGKETRVTTLGHVQRGGSPTPFDRILGTRFGTAAVHLAFRRGFGRMVCLKPPDIKSVPLHEAVGVQKLVPPDGELINMAKALGICMGI